MAAKKMQKKAVTCERKCFHVISNFQSLASFELSPLKRYYMYLESRVNKGEGGVQMKLAGYASD